MLETGILRSTEMAARLAEALYVAFLGALILNIIQRRHQARGAASASRRSTWRSVSSRHSCFPRESWSSAERTGCSFRE
jgi:hypothetical protein